MLNARRRRLSKTRQKTQANTAGVEIVAQGEVCSDLSAGSAEIHDPGRK